ncbi:MAG: GNAT family N-acetyltransferase, partial [Ruminiclostridium sp.]|nr:GNAT family N-acetyltransferase [Ruminiclostridium sp.]
VAVRPSCRRMGLADRLLDVFIRFGQANLAFLTLEVRPSNTPAVALYEKNGFKEVGRRPNYYDNPKEDALLLTREFAR